MTRYNWGLLIYILRLAAPLFAETPVRPEASNIDYT